MKNNQKHIIGIDEAGRGPLAGPVAVGVVCVSEDFDWSLIPGVNDSKKLTEKKREEIFKIAKKFEKEGTLHFAVAMVSAKIIDQIGIVPAVRLAMKRALKSIEKRNTTVNRGISNNTQVKLDGGLEAPDIYKNQETIIKGDSKEKVIGLASIMAKVTRDRHMQRIAQKEAFAVYDFATHKGYGTKKHREAITQHGLSSEHRNSFCSKLLVL